MVALPSNQTYLLLGDAQNVLSKHQHRGYYLPDNDTRVVVVGRAEKASSGLIQT